MIKLSSSILTETQEFIGGQHKYNWEARINRENNNKNNPESIKFSSWISKKITIYIYHANQL
jgi:hypothetical protein